MTVEENRDNAITYLFNLWTFLPFPTAQNKIEETQLIYCLFINRNKQIGFSLSILI